MSSSPGNILGNTLCGIALRCVVFIASATAAGETVLHVSPQGNDNWSGRDPIANADRTDGPLATLTGARDAIRKLRAGGAPAAPVVVQVHGGVYRMAATFVLESQDSGTEQAPVTYAAHQNEKPVLSGGRVISGWKAGPEKLWSAQLPDVAAGKWCFQQLFVNGQRRTRARSPNEGFYYVAGKAPGIQPPGQGQAIAGQTPVRDRIAFVFAAGEIKQWPDMADANIVVFHSWETSRHRIKEINAAERVVTFTGPAAWPFENWGPKQRYFVENVREALDAPGEWYLDRTAGTVYYYPLPGEDPATAEFVAPALTRLVELRGNPDKGQFVQHVTLRGLTFSHEDWVLEPQGHSDPQAVVTAPAALMADGARHCVIENCEVSHVGDYAVWLRRGCKHNRIVHNRLCDLGVGGVRIGEATMPPSDETESSHNLVDNNHIFDGGHVYAAGIGIWVAQSSYNVILHNEIHDFFYSGMSIGWNWDDAPNRCHHNLIELNHVHHLVKGLLSDAGAIYTLGVSPGSIIRNNLFHDVWSYHEPPLAWGIYLDATCGGYLVENNVVYHTLSGGLMYNNGGHEHVIRNNIFALSANHQIWPYTEKRPTTFRHNIVYYTQGTLFWPHAEAVLRQRLAAKESLGTWDENVYWHAGGTGSRQQTEAARGTPDQIKFFRYTFANWQALGLDGKSRIADPQFEDADACDFRLKPTSPALALGFKPIDLSNVGLYGNADWVAEARAVKYPPTVMPPPPPPPKPTEVDDDFEKTAVGARPEGTVVSGEERGASIRVTEEQAAGGKRSLKITDSKALTPTWQPHLYYEPHITGVVVRQSFDVRLEPGALMFTEWRDAGTYPQNIGVSVSFDGTGRVSVSGKVLATIPVSTWVHIEIEAPLGKDPRRHFTLTVVAPGAQPQVFADLAMPGSEFQELHWLGFSSTAAADSVFYLDNMRIKRTPPKP